MKPVAGRKFLLMILFALIIAASIALTSQLTVRRSPQEKRVEITSQEDQPEISPQKKSVGRTGKQAARRAGIEK